MTQLLFEDQRLTLKLRWPIDPGNRSHAGGRSAVSWRLRLGLLIGTGLTTGTKYHATGETHSVSNNPADGGFNNKFEDIFRIIGPGPGNNLLVHENFHLKVDPDGTVTLFHDTFSVTCK